MYRICALCGREFIAQRATAKYCGSSCRAKRSTRNKRLKTHGGVAEEFSSPVKVGAVAPITNPTPTKSGSVFDATQQALVQAGRLNSPQGAIALVLAGRLDDSALDTGNGVVALSKELDRLLCSILNAAERAIPDELDELQARRRAKAAEAGS
jgi:hypothetical protein